MSDSLAISLACCCGGLALMVVVAVGGFAVFKIIRGKNAGKKLAESMGLTPLNQTDQVKEQWYGGSHNERRFAIRPVPHVKWKYVNGRRHNDVTYYMGIVLEAKPATPLGFVAICDREQTPSTVGFVDAFNVSGTEAPSDAAKAAMLQFVQKTVDKGDQGFALYVADSALFSEQMHIHLMPSQTLPDVAAVLITHHENVNLTPEQLQSTLADLERIAEALET